MDSMATMSEDGGISAGKLLDENHPGRESLSPAAGKAVESAHPGAEGLVITN